MTEIRPVCTRCKVTSCLVWQRDQYGAIICLDCQAAEKTAKAPPPWVPLSSFPEPSSQTETTSTGKTAKSSSKPAQPVRQQSPAHSQPYQSLPVSGVTTRRTTRSHERAKARQQQSRGSEPSPSSAPPTITVVQPSNGRQDTSKGAESPIPALVESIKLDTPPSPVPSGNGHSTTPTFASRRSLRQSQSVQAAERELYTITSSSIQHQGVMFEVGDVVSVLDIDGGVYYGVAQGFLLDQYAHKLVLLTWLLPKSPNPMHFDPAMFILGPEDDTPRSMDQIEFVCHSPQSRHFQGSYVHNITAAEMWLTSNS